MKNRGNGKEWKWHDEGEINWFPEDFAWQNYINPDMIEKEDWIDRKDLYLNWAVKAQKQASRTWRLNPRT